MMTKLGFDVTFHIYILDGSGENVCSGVGPSESIGGGGNEGGSSL